MGRETKIYCNLTRKQLIFVKTILQGKSATQAVLNAYNTNKPNVAAQIAYENLNKPYVKEAIKEMLRSKGLTVDTIVCNLAKIAKAKPDKITGNDKLNANLALLKVIGAYNK